MNLSDNTRGVLLMCGSMLAFTLNDTLVKAVLHDGMPLYQVIALRGIGASFSPKIGICSVNKTGTDRMSGLASHQRR